MRPSIAKTVPAFALLLLIVGCGSNPPREEAPPPPPMQPLLVTIEDPPVSTLRIPVTIDLDFVSAKAVQALPRPFVRDTIHKQVQMRLPGGMGYSPAVGVAFRHQAELEALDLKLRGDTLVAVARVGFRIGSAIEGGSLSMGIGSCGERAGDSSAGIEFTLRGRTAWGPDGTLSFAPQPWSLRWIRPCELTAFRIRLEDILDLPLVRTRVGAAIDGAVRRIPDHLRIRPHAERAWAALATPRRILPGMFLAVRPETLSLGPLRGDGRMLATSLVLQARPWIGTDSTPWTRPLPPLRVDTLPDNGFRLDLQARLPLALVDSTVSALLANLPSRPGERPVRIRGARIFGGGDRAVVAVDFAEPFRGEVFLRGRPEFDSLGNAIRFADLDFDIASRSFLVRTAEFLLHGSIRESIAKAAVLPIDRFLSPLSQLSIPVGDGALARVGVRRIRPLGIAIGEAEIQAWVRAEGLAAVQVGGAR